MTFRIKVRKPSKIHCSLILPFKDVLLSLCRWARNRMGRENPFIVPCCGPSASHICLVLPKTRCILTRPSLFRLYLVILLLCISCPVLLSLRQVSQILLSHFHWQMLLKLFSTSPMRFRVCFLLAFSIFFSSDVSFLVLPNANVAFCNPKDCFLSNPLLHYILEIVPSLSPLLWNHLFVQMSRERSSRNSHIKLFLPRALYRRVGWKVMFVFGLLQLYSQHWSWGWPYCHITDSLTASGHFGFLKALPLWSWLRHVTLTCRENYFPPQTLPFTLIPSASPL